MVVRARENPEAAGLYERGAVRQQAQRSVPRGRPGRVRERGRRVDMGHRGQSEPRVPSQDGVVTRVPQVPCRLWATGSTCAGVARRTARRSGGKSPKGDGCTGSMNRLRSDKGAGHSTRRERDCRGPSRRQPRGAGKRVRDKARRCTKVKREKGAEAGGNARRWRALGRRGARCARAGTRRRVRARREREPDRPRARDRSASALERCAKNFLTR
jgi:hypothetical protein